MWETKTTYRSSWTYDYNRRPSDDEGKQVEVRKVSEEYVEVYGGSERRTLWETRDGRLYREIAFSASFGHASYSSFLPI
jgi:hypothetical protein